MNTFYIPEPRPPKTVPPQVVSAFELEIDALIQAPSLERVQG